MDKINYMSVSVPEGGRKMSIYDEHEIERLRDQAEKLHWALKASEQKLKEELKWEATTEESSADHLRDATKMMEEGAK